jgi:hypothetical protein
MWMGEMVRVGALFSILSYHGTVLIYKSIHVEKGVLGNVLARSGKCCSCIY